MISGSFHSWINQMLLISFSAFAQRQPRSVGMFVSRVMNVWKFCILILNCSVLHTKLHRKTNLSANSRRHGKWFDQAWEHLDVISKIYIFLNIDGYVTIWQNDPERYINSSRTSAGRFPETDDNQSILSALILLQFPGNQTDRMFPLTEVSIRLI